MLMLLQFRARSARHAGACSLTNAAIASGSEATCPRARSCLCDQRCRSLSSSVIRPVRHTVPLWLSMIARPHEVGLVDSWRADSQGLGMARSRNYPMCENTLLGGILELRFPRGLRGIG